MKHHKHPFPLDIFNPNDRHDRAFIEFHTKHPEVYKWYKYFAFAWRRAGHRIGSSEQFIQRVRFESGVNKACDGGYKVSNNHRKRYAMLLANEQPKAFGNFFRFRKQR